MTDAGCASVRELFQLVADKPGEERDRILSERGISPELRAEIDSLLQFDSPIGESLTQRVAGAAQEAVRVNNRPASGCCGSYRLVELLGCGGMGAVYRAERRDGEVEQKAAIKVLRA